METLQIKQQRISLDIWWLQTMNLVVFLRGQSPRLKLPEKFSGHLVASFSGAASSNT